MLGFVGSNQLHVVVGEPQGLYGDLGRGVVRLDAIAGAAVMRGPSTAQLYDVMELEDLLARLRRGEDVLPAFLERPEAMVVPEYRPVQRPAVLVQQGDVKGAWLELRAVAPPRSAPPRSAPPRWALPSTAAGDEPPSSAARRPAPPRYTRRRLRRGGIRPGPESAAEPEAGGPPTGDRTIRRTPHLDAPSTVPTAPGTSFVVAVYTDAQAFAQGEEGEGVEIETPPDVDRVDVQVILVVSEHFEVDGDAIDKLVIERDVDRSERVPFKVKVVADAPDRTAGMQALFLYRGRPCGHVGRTWDWHAGQPEAATAQAEPAAAVSLPVHTEVERPDLSVIVAAPIADGTHYQCAVETALIPGYDRASFTPWGVEAMRHRYVETLLAAITDEDRAPRERRRAIEEAGYEVWEAAPPIFKQVLWALVDGHKRPRSIYIASAEPTLPWELMIPTRRDGGDPDELPPLGVEFAIGRWTRHDAASPPPGIPVRSAAIIAPRYAGERKLDSDGEIAFVTTRLNGQHVSPATVDDLDRFFSVHETSLLHFVCHGAANIEDDDALYLDKEQALRSRTLRTLSGLKGMCKAHRPIVFVNACDTGRQTPSLAGGAGFPRAFGDIGARAIIAPLWPVDDGHAHDTAIELYTEALKPGAPPLAEVLRRIRRRAYEHDDADTYAAYCFYGDPLAKLTLEPS